MNYYMSNKVCRDVVNNHLFWILAYVERRVKSDFQLFLSPWTQHDNYISDDDYLTMYYLLFIPLRYVLGFLHERSKLRCLIYLTRQVYTFSIYYQLDGTFSSSGMSLFDMFSPSCNLYHLTRVRLVHLFGIASPNVVGGDPLSTYLSYRWGMHIS